MSNFSSCGRRIGAYALCLYMVGFSVFAAGDPGDGNTFNCGPYRPRPISLYAGKANEINKFKDIEVVYHRAAQLQSPLKKIAEAVPKSEDPPENKEALQHLCNEFSNGLEGIINATKDYAERGRMLREARQIIIELKSGSPTIMRSNELNKAMKLLDQSFECKYRLLSHIHQNDMYEYVSRLLDIQQFVNTHKVPEPSAKEGGIMEGKVNDAPNAKPPFYYGSALDRKRTDPQYLADTLNIIRADLNKIDVILRDPLMEDKGSVDAVNNILSYFHKFEVKAQDFVKFVSQCLKKFGAETRLFKRMDTIINQLNALDVNSHKAIPYLKRYKKVESKINELLVLKETIVLEDLQREVSQILHKLPQLVDDIKLKKRSLDPPPLSQPRKPQEQPAKAQEQPAQPVARKPQEQPAKSQEQPAQPVARKPQEQPVKAQEEPAIAQEQPAQPVARKSQEEPAKAQEQPAQPVARKSQEQPAKSQEQPAKAQEQPAQPVARKSQEQPVKAQEQPAQPVARKPQEQPAKSQEQPAQPVARKPQEQPAKAQEQPPLSQPRKAQEEPVKSQEQPAKAQEQPVKSQEQPSLQSIETCIPTLDEASRESVKQEGSGGAVKSARFRNHHELTSGVAKVGINSFGIILALGVIGAL